MKTKELYIRVIVEWVLLFNGLLTSLGVNPIPVSENQLYLFVSLVATVVAFAYAMWKNHNFTTAAKEAQKYLDIMKAHSKDDEFEYCEDEDGD